MGSKLLLCQKPPSPWPWSSGLVPLPLATAWLCCPCLSQLGKMNALRSEHDCGYLPSILQLDGLLLAVPLALALTHRSGTTWLENTTAALLELGVCCPPSTTQPTRTFLPQCAGRVRGASPTPLWHLSRCCPFSPTLKLPQR